MDPYVSEQEYAEARAHAGQLLLDLALEYNLVGHTEFASDGKQYYLMDLHPFHQMDALNMSKISWVMQVAFNLHLLALGTAHFITEKNADKFPENAQTFPFRCLVPDATNEDHEHFRDTIVKPYMLRSPSRFSVTELLKALDSNRLTRALCNLCPPEFARP